MADSLNDLLNWFAARTRISPMDVVVAYRGDKFNHLLEQLYIQHFKEDAGIPPFSAPVVVDGYLKYYLHDFKLGAPSLSFDDGGLDDSKAKLKMEIFDGTTVTLEALSEAWRVTALNAITPLHGPVLTLHLALADVGGVVKPDGRMLLDLKSSSDFSVDIEDSPDVRLITGELFKDLFLKLPDEKRVYVLATIKTQDTYEYMRPKVFACRTQRDSDAAGGGSVLFFISMKDDFTGRPPSESADFRFLHPKDRPESTATLALGLRRTLVYALEPMLRAQFNRVPVISYDDQRLGSIAVSNALTERAPAREGIREFLEWDLTLAINTPPGQRDALEAPNLIVRLDDVKGALEWSFDIDVTVDYIGTKSDAELDPELDALLRAQLGNGPPIHSTYKANYTLEGGTPVRVRRQPGAFTFDEKKWREEIHEYFFARYKFYGRLDDLEAGRYTQVMIDKCVAHAHNYAALVLKDLDTLVDIDVDVNAVLDNIIIPSLPESIVEGTTYGQCDALRFGRLDVHADVPQLTPKRAIVGVGKTRQFQAGSAIDSWEVEPLDGAVALGRIDSNGLYTAPADALVDGRAYRERVKATTRSGGYSSSLVTVCRPNLLVSPLVQVCTENASLQLAASSTLANPETLQWALEGQEKGRLESTQGQVVRYTAPSKQVGEQYVIDEVVVRDPAGASTDTFRVYLITAMKTEPASIRVSKVVPGKSAALIPLLNVLEGDVVEWTVRVGPGSVALDPSSEDGVGVYTQPAGTTERFALVEMTLYEYSKHRKQNKEDENPEPLGINKGFVILPLPLFEYTL